MGTNLVQDTNTSTAQIYNTYLVQSLLLLEGKWLIKSLHWLPILRKEVFKKFLSGLYLLLLCCSTDKDSFSALYWWELEEALDAPAWWNIYPWPYKCQQSFLLTSEFLAKKNWLCIRLRDKFTVLPIYVIGGLSLVSVNNSSLRHRSQRTRLSKEHGSQRGWGYGTECGFWDTSWYKSQDSYIGSLIWGPCKLNEGRKLKIRWTMEGTCIKVSGLMSFKECHWIQGIFWIRNLSSGRQS